MGVQYFFSSQDMVLKREGKLVDCFVLQESHFLDTFDCIRVPTLGFFQGPLLSSAGMACIALCTWIFKCGGQRF